MSAETTKPPPSASPTEDAVGALIGPYRLVELLGQGGMGAVYLAEQTEPVRRRVALKLVKLGMDTRDVLARFSSERQALALMNHPNVATVYDAGATPSGRPYFAMEYVRGSPITIFADEHFLSIRDRIDLFIRVCSAVQHAHQKGIVHRDLKPSNVLVTLREGRLEPKVIDFGVAKAAGPGAGADVGVTEVGQILGTPEYMSPEQAAVDQVDIDTRSDVYSLGVLLYELLTGLLPFDPRTLRGANLATIQRMIREVEPPRPSVRVATLAGYLKGRSSPRVSESAAPVRTPLDAVRANPDEWEMLLASTQQSDARPGRGRGPFTAIDLLAQRRHCDPHGLVRALRGDLDWIVMRCLEKDRGRRYESADAVAADLQRHLNNERVLACPPSTRYRLSKFVRRNRVAVVAYAALLLSLLVGLLSTAAALVSARTGWDRAVAAERRERQERERAERALARAHETESMARREAEEARMMAVVGDEARRFVQRAILEAGRGRDLHEVLTVDAVLDEAQEQLSAASWAPPTQSLTDRGRSRIEAHIRMTMAETLLALGRREAASAEFERVASLHRAGGESRELIDVLLAKAECDLDNAQPAGVAELLDEAERLATDAAASRPRAMASILALRGLLLLQTHPDVQAAQATSLLRAARETLRGHGAEVLAARWGLWLASSAAVEPVEAVALAREALTVLSSQLGVDEAALLEARSVLGARLADSGEILVGRAELVAALDAIERLGAASPRVLRESRERAERWRERAPGAP